MSDVFVSYARSTEAQAKRVADALKPESWEVNKETALVSYRQGRFEEAMERFSKAAELMESDYRSAGMVASCARGLNDRETELRAAEETVRRVERVIAEDRTNGAALAYGAIGLATLGEHQRAREWMRRATLIDPDNSIMRYNLACLAAGELEDFDTALEMVKPFMAKANAYQLKHISNDPDMAGLREDPRFQAMIADAKARLGIG